jgi:phosphate transport system substrate-binding protein
MSRFDARLALVLVLLGACSDGGTARAQERRTLVLTGSSTMAPLLAEIAQRFEREHPGVRVDVQTGGSSRGILDAREGRADIGMSSRPLAGEEGAGMASHVVAWDGVAFVVHADNPVRALGDGELRGILTGAIGDWREVGGPEAEIVVVNRADGRSELELVTDYLGIEALEVEADAIAGENQQVVKTVVANRRAISYLSIGTSEHEIARGTALALLSLGGVEASSAAVRRGEFPLARPLLLVTTAEASGLAMAFIDYARSGAVRELIEAYSFVPAD